MNKMIKSSNVTAVIRSFVEMNDDDEATTDLIIAIGAQLLDVPFDTMSKMVDSDEEAKEPCLKTILLMFDFKTGDATCPYWTEFAVVYAERENLKEIEDGLASYMDSPEAENAQYDDIVKAVLHESGFQWEYIENRIGNIPGCDMFHRFEI